MKPKTAAIAAFGMSEVALHAVLEAQVDTKGLVECCDPRWSKWAAPIAYPFDGYGADLFRLCFRVPRQACLLGWQQHLEGIDASRIGGHRYHGDDSPPETGCRGISRIVADDHRRPGLAGLRSAGRVQAYGHDLAAAHSVSQAVSGGRLPGTGVI